ncbi:MAG: hypothetical protein KAT71_03515, partial [Gammaproteobacteria bacterium]|nr:hypothetical protein [Gammaproteobacteria bacterium]
SMSELFAKLAFEENKLKQAILQQMVELLAKLHNVGASHLDLHLGNFIYAENDVLYLIDSGKMHFARNNKSMAFNAGLKQLALLLAQAVPQRVAICDTVYPIYTALRNLPVTASNLAKLKRYFNHYCKQKAKLRLKKIFRNCSRVVYQKSWRRRYICQRNYCSQNMLQLFNQLDSAIEQGEKLKKGTTCTVAKVVWDKHEWVIKRYNIKSFFHLLKRMFRPSRAAFCWANAHLLQYYQIPTPAPVAILEQRFGPFRFKSYFITEYLESTSVNRYFSQQQAQDDGVVVANEVVGILCLLSDKKIRHGDTKPQNFIIHQRHVYLTDLDSMRQCSKLGYRLSGAFKKDLQRFVGHWHKKPEVQHLFLELFNLR